jgi:predicted metal-dependent phosphoesterase TrpH
VAAHPLGALVVTVRSLSLVLLAAGLTMGSLADRTEDRSSPRVGGRIILTADLHVHAFPGDGVLSAWDLRKEAARRGLDVIAITNHNQSIAASLPVGSNRDSLPLVIPGQEVTTPAFHLAAVGVRRVVDWRLSLSEVIDAVHSQGGVAIAAHPLRDSWRVSAPDAMARLDGAEAVSRGRDRERGRQIAEFYSRGRQLNPSLAAIGSSDFHAVAPLGRSLTYIAVDDVSERGVLDAIKRGRTAGWNGLDTFVGDPEIVKVVRDTGAGGTRSTGAEPWRTLAVLMVLGALVGLVCFR